MADRGPIGGDGGDARPTALATGATHPAAANVTHAPPAHASSSAMHTPVRPPAISTSAASHNQQTPPGSPMDVDFEARSPAASPSHGKHAKKPVISVFDWDDTLCPSSWLFREGLLAGYGLVDEEEPIVTEPSSFGGSSNDEPEDTAARLPKKRLMDVDDHHALRVFEDHVLAMLQTARQYGPVFIITAAKLQWVRQCAESFLPNVLQVLTKSDSVHVISAREFYAEQSRRMGSHQSKMAAEGTPLAWKTIAFEAVCAHLRVDDYVRRSRSSSGKHSVAPMAVDFVSVGDSLCERDACRFLAMKAPSMIHSKTLKYLDQPKLLELAEQVKMTKGLYDQICRYHGSLDLHVVRSRGSLEVVQLHSSRSPAAATAAAVSTATSASTSAPGPPLQQSIPTAISEEVRARAELQRRSTAAAAVSCSSTSLRKELHEEPATSGISVSGPRTTL